LALVRRTVPDSDAACSPLVFAATVPPFGVLTITL
jgi:hypothetical protein